MLRKRSKGKIREAVKEKAGSRDYKAVKAAIKKMPLLKSLVTKPKPASSRQSLWNESRRVHKGWVEPH